MGPHEGGERDLGLKEGRIGFLFGSGSGSGSDSDADADVNADTDKRKRILIMQMLTISACLPDPLALL